jgi:hypothetical protein
VLFTVPWPVCGQCPEPATCLYGAGTEVHAGCPVHDPLHPGAVVDGAPPGWFYQALPKPNGDADWPGTEHLIRDPYTGMVHARVMLSLGCGYSAAVA